MLAQKKKLAEATRDLANYTTKAEHIEAAKIAEEAYQAHKLTDERMKAVSEKDGTQVIKTQVVENQTVENRT